MIAALAECPKVCPQVHLPLQSGSDRILAAMNRTYTLDQYRAIVAKLRAAIPGVALSTDLIVGFPGETADDFERTVETMDEMQWDSAFLFKYSARPDTKSFLWSETVSEEEKGARLARLIALQHAISAERNQALLGHEVEVLVEGIARKVDHQLFGKSAHFKSVVFENDGTPAGTLRRVRIVAATALTRRGPGARSDSLVGARRTRGGNCPRGQLR
jgi:tRNA-2-methylthio-N6-dimethylallyladenosine synthase